MHITHSRPEFFMACPTGRLLCLDVGERYIGVAISDPGRLIATPHPTFHRQSWQEDAAAWVPFLAQFTGEGRIAGLVVGFPKHMNNSIGVQAQRAQAYAELLSSHFNLPVLLWDERLSTQQAQRGLFEKRQDDSRQTRASKKAIKRDLDSAAAAVLLDSVLKE